MTLLEAMTALVILGASAAGFLGVFQASARSAQAAREWHRATAAAGAALEESVRALRGYAAVLTSRLRAEDGTPLAASLSFRALRDGSEVAAAIPPEVRVSVVPWNGTVDEIVVRAVLPDGRSLVVHRLVRHR